MPAFSERLVSGVEQFRILDRVDSGLIGREDEVHLIYRERPLREVAHIAPQLLAVNTDAQIVGELGANQVEFNFNPVPLGRGCFERWNAAVRDKFATLQALAAEHGAYPLYTAIPPTLTAGDLSAARLKPGDRIARLERWWTESHASVQRQRGSPLELAGFVPASVQTFASMSAVQYHLELSPDPHVAGHQFNLHRFLTPLGLAPCVGSPLFLGAKGPYAEFRVPIWEQLGDAGRGRVSWGKGWVDTPFDELMDCVSNVPFKDFGDDYSTWSDWDLLLQHLKTCWRHVRLIPARNHWRVENRVFPSVHPEDANVAAAWYFGLVLGAAQRPEFLSVRNVPFASVVSSFQAVVKDGLDARIVWLDGSYDTARNIGRSMLAMARDGLRAHGVDDADYLLDVIAARLDGGFTPAESLLRKLASFGEDSAAARAVVTDELIRDQERWM